jgi:hypothetical protein
MSGAEMRVRQMRAAGGAGAISAGMADNARH